MTDHLRESLLKITDRVMVDAAGVSNAPQLVEEIIAVFRRTDKKLAEELRTAFDEESVPRKNIALRRAWDALTALGE